jgi:hypothetical protein
MFRIFEYIIIGFAASFLLIAICLVYLNWNEGLKEKTISGFFIVAVTVFALVYANLREQNFEESFRVSIAVDNRSHLPVQTISTSGGDRLVLRQFQFSRLSEPKIVLNGQERVLFQAPSNAIEETTFYLELLQYVLLQEVLESEADRTTLVSIGPGGAEMMNGVHRPYRPTNSAEIDVSEFPARFPSNRFLARPEGLAFFAGVRKFRLPSNPRIEISHEPSSPDIGPERSTIRLKDRRQFFDVKFVVTPLGTAHKTSISGLPISQTEASYTDTHAFLVTVEAVFNKFRSQHWEMAEYMKWTERTFEQLRRELADAGG